MRRVWKILLGAGCAPFAAALGFCLFGSLTGRGLSFGEYLVFYSFLYWPTYAVGIALIVLALVKRRGGNR